MSEHDVVKSHSQVLQKEMISRNYDRITSGESKVSSTFVPGNLNELLMCFDIANNLPEINAIQNAMRKKSGDFITEAERSGHSEDVCTYVKADIGMMAKGNIAPNGKPFPDPDMLLLSYTGCFTFLKWFELLREQYKCPTVMLHVPYVADGRPTQNMRDYIIKQLKEEVIPTMEKVSGIKFDIDRLRAHHALCTRVETEEVPSVAAA
jgi:benzoyl-CoA reductase subunit B